MATATSDARLSDLSRDLAASKQKILSLENELRIAKATIAAANSRPSTPRQPVPPPAPPPAPKPAPQLVAAPTQPAPPSPGTQRALEAAQTRAFNLEQELKASKAVIVEMRAEVRRLEVTLARRPAPGECSREELDKLGTELEEERERRRSLQRRLDEAQRLRRPAAAPLCTPQPKPPPRETTAEEERRLEEEEAETRRLLSELGGRLGKLEHRKETHEAKLVRKCASLTAEVASLQRQLQAAKNMSSSAATSARGGFNGMVGLGGMSASNASPRARAVTRRPPSARDTLLSSSVGGGLSACGGSKHSPRDPVQRLQQLDPEAAAAIVERKGAMAALRMRLVGAQAQNAAEAGQVSRIGAPFG